MLTRCPCPGNFFESVNLPFDASPDIVGAYWYVRAKDRPPIPGWKYFGPAPSHDGWCVYRAADGKWSIVSLMHWGHETPMLGQVGFSGDKFRVGDYDDLRALVTEATMKGYEDIRTILPVLVNEGFLSSADFSYFEHAFFSSIQQNEVQIQESTL
jgi:hypothetical protein